MTNSVNTILQQMIRFGFVGGIAALVHLLIALLLVEMLDLTLPLANVVAFLVAFWVSLFGHQFFSFQAHHIPIRQTFGRFFLVAVSGFIVNESCVIVLKNFTNLCNGCILIVAIIITSLMTFVLSRQFAFKPS